MLVCNCGLSKSPLADIISGVIEACQRSSLISLRPHGNSSRQNAGIVYLRRGKGFMLKRFTLKNALSNQLPQNPSAATSRHAPSWKLADVVVRSLTCDGL